MRNTSAEPRCHQARPVAVVVVELLQSIAATDLACECAAGISADEDSVACSDSC